MIDPVTGALIVGGVQGLLGAGAGYLSSRAQSKYNRAQLEELKKLYPEYAAALDKEIANISETYDPYLADREQNFQELMRYGKQFDPSKYEVGLPEEFAYKENVQSFLDPSIAYQMQRGRENLEQGAAGAGGLFSGATARALQEEGQKFAQTDWQNAYGRMISDRDFKYRDYRQNYTDRINQAANNLNLWKEKYNLLSKPVDFQQGMAMNKLGATTSAQRLSDDRRLGNLQAQGDIRAQQSAEGSMMLANILGGLSGGAKTGIDTYTNLSRYAPQTAQTPQASVDDGFRYVKTTDYMPKTMPSNIDWANYLQTPPASQDSNLANYTPQYSGRDTNLSRYAGYNI